MTQFRTHYDNLQVTRNANEVIIRAAYKALSQKYHPDKNIDNPELAHRRMKLINQAYLVLSDLDRRAEHDAWIQGKEDEAREEKYLAKKNADILREQDLARKNAASKEQPHFSATDKDVEQAKDRFRANAERAATTQSWEHPKTTVTSSGPTSSNKSGGLHFVHVIMLCIAGGWLSVLRLPDAVRAGYDRASFFELLLNAGFLGRALAPAIVLLMAAVAGWIIGWLVRPWRRNASWVALLLSSVLFFALWEGSVIQQDQQRKAIEVTNNTAAPVEIAPAAVINQSQKDLYDAAVREMETRHPEINPDLPGYRKDLVQEILQRKETYEKNGLASPQALRRAVADMERTSTTQQYTQKTESTGRRPQNAAVGNGGGRGMNEAEATSYQRLLSGDYSQKQESTKCVIKPVMTDEELARCRTMPLR